jgi:hypothetical protein
MKIMENCQRCGKYAKLKSGICRRCKKELEEEAQGKKEESKRVF